MTHVPEELLALYARGDLEPKELRSIEEHLGTCRECQDLLAEFRGDLVALESRLDGPTADELLALRRGVIQQLQKKRRVMAGWRWATAGVAVTIAVFTVLFFHPKLPPKDRGNTLPLATAHLRVPYRPMAEVSLPNLKQETTHAQRAPRLQAAGIRSVNLLAEQDGQRTLEMTTGNPNVVILWQLDERTRDRD